MKFPELVPAIFLSRPNRFVAMVQLEDGTHARAYVPTTGRLTNALQPGCRVWLAQGNNPHRKTKYTLILTELPNGGYCSVQAIQANRLFAEALAAGTLQAFSYDWVQAEVTHGVSRLDFRLSSDLSTCWVEVKSVTYAADGVGKFPDAPTGRGRKHLKELARLARLGDRASAVFIAQREDAQAFTPFEEIDPEFSAILHEAHQHGVEVHAYRCSINLDEITINEEIPVRL
ncbi:MAG: DNA/RNA nuclease SfsA [Brevefilum sp.]